MGENAGTNDFLLKKLELELISNRVEECSAVLDIGCGNGLTLLHLVKNKHCTGVGVDFSPELLKVARKSAIEQGVEKEAVAFLMGDIEDLAGDLGVFDYVLTERCLINLESAERQHRAFLEIMKHVRVGGRYLMIESFIQGLERINELRISLGLERIDPPWHNVFLDEDLVKGWGTGEIVLEEIYPFSSTYYFLSRVVYAKIAEQRSEGLRYDSDINLVACRLPPIGDFGPTRLWQWMRLSPPA